ncbi:MAG: glycosyltransferase [Balneolaceae bacterium]
MKSKSLEKIYSSLNERVRIIYVVPLIRFSHKDSDYLYLLYKDLINADKFEIQSISVISHFKMVLGILKHKQAILHYHWLEFQDLKSLLGMPWKFLCIRLFKLFGGNIVWTIHNEFPHDQRFLKLHCFLHRKMASWADKLHVHCEIAIENMSSRLNVSKKKFFIHNHPTFPAVVQPKRDAIDQLNKEYDCDVQPGIPLILMFGNISRYKQIEKVVEMIIELPVEAKLIIVGPIKKGNMSLFRELKKLDQKSNRIKLIPRFIKEEHVPWFYNASDICLFNYREILSSGGIHLAMSYKKKIIAPNKGCISELRHKPDVHLFESQDELKDLLLRELTVHNG